MARGVHYQKAKTVVKIAALDMFLDEFVPYHMTRALIDLVEFAVTHPDFGTQGNPGAVEYDWADQATDILTTFFEDENCCEDDGATAPKVAIDSGAGAIELLKRRYRSRRRKEPSLAAATRDVPVRLAARPAARN